MGSDAEEKRVKTIFQVRSRCLKASALLVQVVALVLAYSKVYGDAFGAKKENDNALIGVRNEIVVAENNVSTQMEPKNQKLLDHFEGCAITFKSPPAKGKGEWTTKPIRLPSYPNTLEESTHKSIVNAVTGLEAGGKSFYASMRGGKLRQCFGETETVTCTNIHPIVNMKGGPDQKGNKFFPKYIMGIRNPMTVLPAFYNGKAIKYHGVRGQVPEDDWRRHRDTYLAEMMDGWESVLRTWKASNNYHVGFYLVYEHLMGPSGPAILKRLATFLREAGFVIAADDDIPCIWYNAIGRGPLEQFQQNKYEYTDYIPGYTNTQREFLMNKLSNLMGEFSEEPELVSILKEYHDEIRDNVRIDKEWTSQKAE